MEIQEPYSKTLMDRDDPSQSDAQPKNCVTDSITLGDVISGGVKCFGTSGRYACMCGERLTNIGCLL